MKVGGSSWNSSYPLRLLYFVFTSELNSHVQPWQLLQIENCLCAAYLAVLGEDLFWRKGMDDPNGPLGRSTRC